MRLRRFHNLEKHLEKKPELMSIYSNSLEEFQDLDQIDRVKVSAI